MSDGDALLLAVVRRKGGAFALADWLLDRVPVENFRPTDQPGYIVEVKSRSLTAAIRFAARNDNGVWVRLSLMHGRQTLRMVAPLVWIDLASPGAGLLLARHINEVFIRRRRRG